MHGHIRKDLDGRTCWTVSDDLDRNQYLKTFLHELAHVKLHFNVAPTDKQPQKQTSTAEALAAKDLREKQA